MWRLCCCYYYYFLLLFCFNFDTNWGLTKLKVIVLFVSKSYMHILVVQLLALVNSYLSDWPALCSSPENRGCQETPVSTSSLLPGLRSFLGFLCSTCVYCWLSNTLVSPSLMSQPFKKGPFFLTGSLHWTEILSLWTFAAMIMENVFEAICQAAFCHQDDWPRL